MTRVSPGRLLACTAAGALGALLLSCSINTLAVRAVAGVLSGNGGGTVFTGDDDPALVGDALPFAMKTYESLLQADPGNAPLALATARAFLSYGYAFVLTPAQQMDASQVDEQRAQQVRAKRLFLRGRGYVLQGMEARRPGFGASLDKEGAAAALRLARPQDADYLYTLGATWLAAFSADPFDFDLILSLKSAVAVLQQVTAWDPSYGGGAVQEILISFYGAAPADLGGGESRARDAFLRAVDLSHGLRAGPYVALATSVSVKTQNEAEFRSLLAKALAVDVNASVPDRLVNIINQQKARWLLDHVGDFFLEDETP
jgi:predicted anti-sigma-YlaC factor YlaD